MYPRFRFLGFWTVYSTRRMGAFVGFSILVELFFCFREGVFEVVMGVGAGVFFGVLFLVAEWSRCWEERRF